MLTAVTSLSLRGARRQLLDHVRVPLFRDGYALALNSAFTAATGLLYWIVAAKTYSAHALGLNSALISSMMFLAGIASLNLPNILVRFLPRSGHRTAARVRWAYVTSAALALCAALVFTIGVGGWSPKLSFLHSDRGLQAWFLLSTLAWCLFAIQDSVLTALGRAIWVPVENAVFSLVKLGLLAALATLTPRYGIFVSWTIAMLVSVIGVNVVIFGRLIRRGRMGAGEPVSSMRDRAFGRYFAADYACSVSWLSTTNLMPIIVTAAAGATANAYYALAYAVALPLYAGAQNIGTSLTLHGTRDPAALPVLARKALVQGARVLIPAALLLVVLAPHLLALFGPTYATKSATVLRLLALGAIANLVLALAVSVARVRRRLRWAVVALATEAVLALSLATPLLHSFGVAGVGIAWGGAQCLVALAVLLTWRGWVGDGTVPAEPIERAGAERVPALDAAAGPERLPALDAAAGPERLPALDAAAGPPHPMLRSLFARLERERVRWTLLRLPSNPAAPTGDVDLLVAPDDAARLRDLAVELGFVALPGWESIPDLILVRYDQPSDQWLILDICTEVGFRAPRGWRLAGGADDVLERCVSQSGMRVPAESDAFWLLLLHCLLDKRSLPSHYLPRLRRFAAGASQSPLGAAVCAAAGGEFTPVSLQRAAASGDWDELAALREPLIAALRRRRGMRERLRVTMSRLRRIVRKPLLVRRRRGINLALLGPNGVGKSTAAAGLLESFPFESRLVYMGMWKRAGGRGSRIAALAEIPVRPLRIWSRYVLAQYHQLRGRLVVFDRYVYEAMLPPQPPLVVLKRIYFWFLVHLIPAPSAAAVLDVPGHVAYRRKQENPPDELESERQVYAELAARVPALDVIDAAADADTVRGEITAIVWRELAARWEGASTPA